MRLRLENGTTLDDPVDDAILASLVGLADEFAILEQSEMTYMQTSGNVTDGFVIEYQEGSTDEHYKADEKVPLDKLVLAFQSYAAGTDAWRSMFEWERMDF